jgi:peptidoglycan hydrolase-like protein with peptidoglycan-binding domain
MHMKNIFKKTRILSLIFTMLISVPFVAHAATISVTGLSTTHAVTPLTPVYFNITQSGFVSPTYSISDSYSGQSATQGTVDSMGYFTWTPTDYDGGQHTLTISATDATNTVATTSVNIIVAATKVFAQSVSPATTIATGRTLTFTAYAPGFDTPSFAIYDHTSGSSITPGNINTSTGAFSWTPTTDDRGVHTLTLDAIDIVGHSAQTTITISVIAPTVTVVSYKSSVVTDSISVFTATSLGLINPKWSVTDIPSGIATSTTVTSDNISPAGVFSWIPQTSDIGAHILTITATDTNGNSASATITLFVAGATTNALTPTTTTTPASPTVTSPITTTTPANTNTTPSVSTYSFTTYLSVGSQGAEVTALQQALTQAGVYGGPVTGYFGALTQTAVSTFQKAHGVSPVGYVGPATRSFLNQIGSTANSSTTNTTGTSTSAKLTPSQISSIIGILQSFGADAATIAKVQTALGQ